MLVLPSTIGKLRIPGYDVAPHIEDMESKFLALVNGNLRRLIVAIPIRHGKTEYINLFIAWLMIYYPGSRILRVMAESATCEMQSHAVIETVEEWGPKLSGVKLDQRKRAVSHFKTDRGGELRSLGFAGSAESWTFDWIIVDDPLVDPYEIRSPDRRMQVYRDLHTKFFSRVNPVGVTKFAFIGSRRHPDDCQGKLLEADRTVNEDQRWHYHHAPAIIDEYSDDERALWPSSKEFTLEGLKSLRDKYIADGVGWEWSSKFQNDPMASPDALKFDPAWFDADEMFYAVDRPVESLPLPKFKVIAVDPSMGAGTETSDFCAAVYMHIAEDATIYIDDSWLGVAKPDEIVYSLTELCARHQDVQVIPFEANAGGLYCAELIKRELEHKGLQFPVAFKTYTARSADEKVARITLNLWDILAKRKLRLRDTPWNRILFRQLRGFPTEKMDGPDALATGVIVLKELLR